MRVTIVAVWLLLFVSDSQAQQEFVLTSRTPIAPTTRSVINGFAYGDGTLVRVWQEQTGIVTVNSARFGRTINGIQQGLTFPSGKEVMLEPFEFVQSLQGDVLVTQRSMIHKDFPEVAGYKVLLEDASFIRSVNFGTWASIAQVGHNIAFSDEIEGSGTTLRVYSSDLDSLNTYVPFHDHDFEEARISASPTKLLAVFGHGRAELYATTFDPLSGRVLSYDSLGVGTGLQHLAAFDNSFVIYGSATISAYGNGGKRLWQMPNMVAPGLDIFNGPETYYFFTKSELVAIHPVTGVIKWRKKLDLGIATALSSNMTGIRPVAFAPLADDGAVFVLALTHVGSLFPTSLKENARVIAYDTEGRVTLATPINTPSSLMIAAPTRKGFRILLDREVLEFAK